MNLNRLSSACLMQLSAWNVPTTPAACTMCINAAATDIYVAWQEHLWSWIFHHEHTAENISLSLCTNKKRKTGKK